MPRVYPPKRTAISIRLSPEGLAEVDELAGVEQVGRSEMLRRMFAYALRVMPEGWKP